MEAATLTKVFHIKQKGMNSGAALFDQVLLFYRDSEGNKHTEFVSRAKVPYYILKDKTSPEATSPPLFIEEDKVEKHMVYSDRLPYEIAMATNSFAYYDRISQKDGDGSSNMKNLFKHPYIYDSDMSIEDRYIRAFHDTHETDPNYKLYKCYFDIEVDIMNYNGFPDEDIAPAPINIITLIDEKYISSHTFIVRNPKNTSLIEFEKNLDEFKVYLDQKIKLEDAVVLNSINIDFYDTELEAIEAFFACVHQKNPDFMLAWNEGFDVKTLQNRLKYLYGSKEFKKSINQEQVSSFDLMLNTVCDSQYFLQKNEKGEDIYLSPKAYYKSDKTKSFVDRMDYFMVLDGIQWLDQMLCYAQIR